MTVIPRPVIAAAAAVAAAGVMSACGMTETSTARRPAIASVTPLPVIWQGEAGRVATAVDRLGEALRDGDVERLCHPGAIFTPAVVDEMRSGGLSCEAYVEGDLAGAGPTAPTVTAVSLEPDLATARVRTVGATTVPLTLVRERHRWLVSFSDGNDPLGALTTNERHIP